MNTAPKFTIETKKGKKVFLDAIRLDATTQKDDIAVFNSGASVESRSASAFRMLARCFIQHDIGTSVAVDGPSAKAALVQLECDAFGGQPKKDNPQRRDGGATLPAEYSIAKSCLKSYLEKVKKLPWVEAEDGTIYVKPQRKLDHERKELFPTEEKDQLERLQSILNTVNDPAMAGQMASLCMEWKDKLIETQAAEESKVVVIEDDGTMQQLSGVTPK